MNTGFRFSGAAIAIFLLAAPAVSQESGWTDSIALKGDVRLRRQVLIGEEDHQVLVQERSDLVGLGRADLLERDPANLGSQ